MEGREYLKLIEETSSISSLTKQNPAEATVEAESACTIWRKKFASLDVNLKKMQMYWSLGNISREPEISLILAAGNQVQTFILRGREGRCSVLTRSPKGSGTPEKVEKDQQSNATLKIQCH